MPDFEKKYTEKEFHRIIEKALILQQKDKNPVSTEISRSDLLSMATELGINEKYIAAAMEDPEPNGGTALTKFLGGEYRQNHILMLDKAPATADMHEALNELPDLAGMQGRSNVSSDHFSWNTDSMTSYSQGVSTSINGFLTRDEKFKVEIRESYSNLAGGLFGGIIGGVGVGAGVSVGVSVGIAIGSAVFATLVPVGALAGSYLLCRLIYGNYVKGRKKKLSRIIEFLRERFTEKQE